MCKYQCVTVCNWEYFLPFFFLFSHRWHLNEWTNSVTQRMPHLSSPPFVSMAPSHSAPNCISVVLESILWNGSNPGRFKCFLIYFYAYIHTCWDYLPAVDYTWLIVTHTRNDFNLVPSFVIYFLPPAHAQALLLLI